MDKKYSFKVTLYTNKPEDFKAFRDAVETFGQLAKFPVIIEHPRVPARATDETMAEYVVRIFEDTGSKIAAIRAYHEF